MTPCNEKERVLKCYAEFLTYDCGNEALVCVTTGNFLANCATVIFRLLLNISFSERTKKWLLYTGYTQKNGAENWLLPQLNTNYDDYILQLDGAPPHFHRNVRVLLNRVLQQRWIECAAKGDNHLLPWPPVSQDLTPCDFFLWGFVKDSVYVPPLPMSLIELRDRITHALQTITADTLLQSGMNLITVWMCVVWPRVHTLKDCD